MVDQTFLSVELFQNMPRFIEGEYYGRGISLHISIEEKYVHVGYSRKSAPGVQVLITEGMDRASRAY